MTTEDPALAVAGSPVSVATFEPFPSLPVRVYRGLLGFTKRKPLGAFGAFLVFVPIVAAIILPGIDLGIVELPRIIKYRYDDYELGRDRLVGPSFDHPMGTD